MKTQKKKGQGLYLQKRNNRWKWMAGATAATAGGVTASQASIITINLVGNFISATDGNHLNADLTGDGHPDLTIANAFNYVNRYDTSTYGGTISGRNRYYARVNLNGVLAEAYHGNTLHYGSVRLGSRFQSGQYQSPPYSGPAPLMGSIPLFFKDLHINGGAPTRGSLEVTLSSLLLDGPRAVIQLDSFTYTSNTPVQGSSRAVPDQGSSLALLAMGAGGILALRRWRAAQGSS